MRPHQIEKRESLLKRFSLSSRYQDPFRRHRLLSIVSLSILLLVFSLLPWGEHLAHADAPTDTLTVDASGNLGAPTYRASGFLTGISQPDAKTPPDDSLITPLKPQEWRYGADQVGMPLEARVNALHVPHQEAELNDPWGSGASSYPCDNGDCSTFATYCTNKINTARSEGINLEWDVWNEPDNAGFWPSSRSEQQFFQGYQACYQALRSVDPHAVIVGPSTAWGIDSFFQDFVNYVKANNVVPTYFTWHNLSNSDPVGQVQQAQNVLSQAGVSAQGFIINEWNTGIDPINKNVSANLAWQLARIERSGLTVAGHTCGSDNSCFDGSLDGALVNGQPSGGWWVFKRYADITGHLLPVTAGSTLDGVAGADSTTQQVRVLLGNNSSNGGSMLLRLTNLNNTPYVLNNGQTYVTVEDIPTTSGDNLSAPTVVQSGYATVSNNEVDVPITWNGNDTYNVILSPSAPTGGTGSYQASTGFSSMQGQNQWSYQYSTDGEQSLQNMSWDSTHTTWDGPGGYSNYCDIGANWQIPNTSCDAVRVWQAPSPGTVTLGANGALSVDGSCNNNPGVNIRILRNGSQIWPASGWQLLAHGSTYTFPSGVTTSVASGDVIAFVAAASGSNNYCDTTAWDQTISYSGSTWTKCADEGGTCSFSGTKQVRYGANGQYYYQTATNSIGCNNSVFGDPIVGTFKACSYQ